MARKRKPKAPRPPTEAALLRGALSALTDEVAALRTETRHLGEGIERDAAERDARTRNAPAAEALWLHLSSFVRDFYPRLEGLASDFEATDRGADGTRPIVRSDIHSVAGELRRVDERLRNLWGMRR